MEKDVKIKFLKRSLKTVRGHYVSLLVSIRHKKDYVIPKVANLNNVKEKKELLKREKNELKLYERQCVVDQEIIATIETLIKEEEAGK